MNRTTITPQHVEDLAREFYDASPQRDGGNLPIPWHTVDQSVRMELMNASRIVMERFELNLRDGMGQVIDHHRQLVAQLYEHLAAVAEVAGTPRENPDELRSVLAEVRAISQRGLAMGQAVVH